MTLIDSNVLLDLITEDKNWVAWSEDMIEHAANRGEIAINPLIFAELTSEYDSSAELDSYLLPLGIKRLPLPYEAAFPAGKAFLAYRKRGGTKRSPLPDFYIGAHAQVLGHTILTRDPARYRTYFPEVKLIAPD